MKRLPKYLVHGVALSDAACLLLKGWYQTNLNQRFFLVRICLKGFNKPPAWSQRPSTCT